MAEDPTPIIRKRYDRIAPLFDTLEVLAEKTLFGKWRQLLWAKVDGGAVLELGVGTGKNLPYYPAGAEITAIDFSSAMLQRAQAKAAKRGMTVTFRQMDAQQLDFPADSFDTVVASFVFCSVPDPIKGLQEAARVCRPSGKIILLEHVLSKNPIAARMMNVLNPLVVKLVGANINRRTVDNVLDSGLMIDDVTHLNGMVKLIEAHKAISR